MDKKGIMNGSRQKQVSKWHRLLEKYEESGLSVAEFCRREGLQPHNFRYWHKKYQARSKVSSEGFVSVLPKQSNQVIYIRYRSGLEVELPMDFPVEELAKLVTLTL